MQLEILRVYNNYVLDDEKTLKNKSVNKKALIPAQKIGFVIRKYTVNDILDFTVAKQVIDSKRQDNRKNLDQLTS